MHVGGQSFAAQSDEHLVKAIGKERRTDPGSPLRAAPRLLGDPDVSTRPTAVSRTPECRDGVTLVGQAERNQASSPRSWRISAERTHSLARGW